jgi:hypothetical protein
MSFDVAKAWNLLWYPALLMPPDLLEKGISKHSKPAKQALLCPTPLSASCFTHIVISHMILYVVIGIAAPSPNVTATFYCQLTDVMDILWHGAYRVKSLGTCFS